MEKNMINNYICSNCIHALVCKKVDILEKFDTDSKKYINVDITMESCKDFDACDGDNE